MKVLFILFSVIISCAPLKPLGPTTSSNTKAKANNSSYNKVSKKTEQKNIKSITGIAEWDNVLLPWLGTPYLTGGSSKNGTDCSGFVSSIYREKENMYIPRTTTEEYKMGKSVSKGSLKIGDLVFFGEDEVNHVGIYTGNGNFIHASTSNGVMLNSLDDIYWKPRYIGARRYL